jgi:hypothetical protein
MPHGLAISAIVNHRVPYIKLRATDLVLRNNISASIVFCSFVALFTYSDSRTLSLGWSRRITIMGIFWFENQSDLKAQKRNPIGKRSIWCEILSILETIDKLEDGGQFRWTRALSRSLSLSCGRNRCYRWLGGSRGVLTQYQVSAQVPLQVVPTAGFHWTKSSRLKVLYIATIMLQLSSAIAR